MIAMWEAVDKNVRVVLDDNQIFEGVATDYTSELDNEDAANKPGVASMGVRVGSTTFELYEDEIVSIEPIA